MTEYSKAYQSRRGKTQYLRKGNKYGAKKTKYRNRTYDSKLEANVRARLDLQMNAKEKKDRVTYVQDQYQIEIRLFGKTIVKHKVDFLVKYGDGRTELLEAKGFETKDWIIIRRLIEALLPHGMIENTEKDWTYRVVRK